MTHYKEKLAHIKAFAFDVDGVFSNPNVYLTSDGDMVRTMNTKDGFAVHYAVTQNIPIAIITGGYSESVRKRFNDLGVTDVYIKSYNKLDDLKDFVSKYNLEPKDVLYMGDDLPDYEAMSACGLATCPADAAEEIKGIADYISGQLGGFGCVRDVIEQVLRAQQKWVNVIEQ